jgi:hypothetical protein
MSVAGDTHGKGPSTDAGNRPVDDPTKNVQALVDAGMRRQDDLRELEATHLREIGALRAAYEEKLRVAESARIDAIRAVDVGAVSRAAEVAAAQASTLAAQVTTSAETLRGQVNAAAIAAATALATALQPITKSIEDLRAAQYAQQGQAAAKTEGRDNSQWLITLLVGIGVAVVTYFIAVHK